MGRESVESPRKNTVVLFFTGGTFAMNLGGYCQGVIPKINFVNLIDLLKSLIPDIEIRVIHWSDMPSPHMTPEQMFQLAKDVEKTLEDPSVTGVVIVHGTDVMEETAFMIDLVVNAPNPIILTGAMRYYDEPGFDGLRNLVYSIKACQNISSFNLGVIVLMADRLFSAREVIKIHSTNVDAFDSPGKGPLGFFAGDHLQIIRLPKQRKTFRVEHIEPNVDLIKLYTGMDAHLIHCSRQNKVSGLVLEGFGSGNIPPKIVPAVEEMIELRIPVVLTSRCIQGGAWPIYGYPGGGKDLYHKGVILASQLSGQKARIQLMVALAKTRDLKELRNIFESD